jgi:hypothetical protein
VKQTTPEGEETTLPEPVPVTVVEAGKLAISPPRAGEVQPAGEPVTLEGVGAPGATVTVTDAAGVELGKAVVDALGRWALTLPALEEGVYDLGVKQTTPDGEEMELAAPVALVVSEIARLSITSPEVGETQPAGEPLALEGAGAPGATVAVTDAAGRVLAKAIVDAAGKWRLALPALGVGRHLLDVTQTTPEGEETTLAERVALAVSAAGAALARAAEAAEGPAITSPAVGAVQPAGEPVTLEGTGAPGATITVMDAAGEVLGEALVDAAGKWSLVTSALKEGAYALRVTQTTAEGKETALAEPLALILEAPGVVSPEVTKPGTDLNVVLYALLTLEGIGQPGATIEVMEGTTTLAEAIVEPNGTWQADVVGLGPGIHSLTLKQTTVGGAVAEGTTPVKVTVIGEELPPTLVAEAPALSGEGPAIVRPGETITGIAPAGAVVEVYAGTRLLGRAQADQEGDWQFRLPVSLPRTTRELTIKALGATGALLSETDIAILIGPPTTLPTTGGCLCRPASSKRGWAAE